eukprot:gene7879-biopygen4594
MRNLTHTFGEDFWCSGSASAKITSPGTQQWQTHTTSHTRSLLQEELPPPRSYHRQVYLLRDNGPCSPPPSKEKVPFETETSTPYQAPPLPTPTTLPPPRRRTEGVHPNSEAGDFAALGGVPGKGGLWALHPEHVVHCTLEHNLTEFHSKPNRTGVFDNGPRKLGEPHPHTSPCMSRPLRCSKKNAAGAARQRRRPLRGSGRPGTWGDVWGLPVYKAWAPRTGRAGRGSRPRPVRPAGPGRQGRPGRPDRQGRPGRQARQGRPGRQAR